MVPTRTFSLGHRLSDPDLAAAKHKARRAGAGGSGDVSRAQLTRGFESEFGAQPKIFAAPGRVNLIGEHTDYNDGFVFPSAIEFLTRVAIAPRDDRKLVLPSEGFEDRFEFGLDKLPPTRLAGRHSFRCFPQGGSKWRDSRVRSSDCAGLHHLRCCCVS
ncbi:MAG: hypothetical protein DMG81_12110 [Acidobacteria bacterium]|nr:MAG: hypothetical protein DMG81_12110 [Acidobacteriota bacterium]